MFVRVLTLRFNPATQGFDDDPVGKFLVDKEVLSIQDHFFEQDGVAYLALVICYRLPMQTTPVELAGKSTGNKRDESWRELLTEADMPLFDTLRNWRSERCKQEGVPPYVICNNRQLAQIVKAKPVDLAAIRQIEGLGEAKLKKYGQELLALIMRSSNVAQVKGNKNAP